MADQINLAEYLFRRLAEVGVRSVHGVPGDFNLTACDYVLSTGLRWVGNANELNAGYAADGYARVNGVGALITSFGVGELSAINAIGASYAEKAAVVHIVGTPPRAAQDAGACLHHSLGDGNFSVFSDMFRSVTVAQARLFDPETAAGLIDHALEQCLLHSRPVYINLPSDMVPVKVDAPTRPISRAVPGYSEAFEDSMVNTLLSKMESAKRPLILVDGFTTRFDVRNEINDLVKLTCFPTLTTPFGKGLLNESAPNYHGVYYGMAGSGAHHEWVQGCDLVLRFGPLNSDVNTFGGTAIPNPDVTVTFEKQSVQLGDKTQPSDGKAVSIKSLLGKLVARLQGVQLISEPFPPNPDLPREILKTLPVRSDDSKVDQYSFWLRMSEYLRPGDIVLTETGTSSYGGQNVMLPDDTAVINSSIWLSIGYMLGACQGAALAQRELAESGSRPPGRTILFEGEGSLQMSAQAISDIVRNKLDVTIFVLNNNGYTIERVIHGFGASYNDIQPWRNLEAPSYFGAPVDDPSYPVRTRRVENWGELRSALSEPGIREGRGLNMIEVFMDMADCPASLKTFADYLSKKNGGGS